MQAYATAEVSPAGELRVLDRRSVNPDDTCNITAGADLVLDELVGRLADLVAARVAARLAAPRIDHAEEWLDTRRAAAYLGIHRDSLRRLAAARAIPADQAGAGCKLFFRKSDLDVWRTQGSASVVGIQGRRHG